MSEEPQAARDALESISAEAEARSKEIADRFVEEREGGARPDRAAIVAAQAYLGPQLEERLLAIEAMYALAVDTRSGPARDPLRGLPAAGPAAGLKRLGRFEVIAVLGRGSFGMVYKARDADLDRTVAIKVPRLGAFATSQEEERFLREARHAARLRHPGIVQVHDAGVEGELPYIVSDFIDGETLAARLERERPDFRAAAELVAKIAEALDYAHSQGVVHRDIKPGNILIDLAGEPHLADFGLARRAEGEVTVTLAGEVLGTPAYMAPEQAA